MSKLRICYLAPPWELDSMWVQGLKQFLGDRLVIPTLKTGNMGRKSAYSRMSSLFIDWWNDNFLSEDFDILITSQMARISDLRLMNAEFFDFMPLVYWQHASQYLWMAFPDRRTWDLEELSQYHLSDKVFSFSEAQFKAITRHGSKYLSEETMSKIKEKFKVVPMIYDWKNRDLPDNKTYDLDMHPAGSLISFTDWKFPKNIKRGMLSQFNLIDKVPFELRRGVPKIIWNSRVSVQKEMSKFRDVLKALNRKNFSFDLILSIPGTTNKTEFQNRLQKELDGFDNNVLFAMYDPDNTTYNRLLAITDFWIGTSVEESYCLSMLDAAYHGAIPIVPDGDIFREHIPKEWQNRCIFENYNADDAAEKLIYAWGNKTEFSEFPRDWITKNREFDDIKVWYEKCFSEIYNEMHESRKVKEEGKTKEILDWIKEAPISKREIFKRLGWASPKGWPIYRHKLTQLGVKSMKVNRDLIYYVGELKSPNDVKKEIASLKQGGLF